MPVKKHKTISSGMLYGCALGIIIGFVFNDIFSGMLYCMGIGSIIDLIKYYRKSKSNK